VIPDLDDLAVVAESEDVHARERRTLARRRNVAPRPGMGARGGPASRDQVAIAEHEIDLPVDVRKRASELLCDQGLPGRARRRVGRAKVVTDVVVREHFVGKTDVSAGPDLLVETANERFVRLDVHRSRSYAYAAPVSDPLAGYLDELRRDDATLGLLLHGSRAGGVERPDSDFDLIRIVTDEAFEARKEAGMLLERIELPGPLKADVLYQSFGRLDWNTENLGWATATYIEARVLLDKADVTARVQAIVDRAGEVAAANVPEEYDAYLNYWVRSLKAWRRGDELGGRLHAASSAFPLVRTLFGLERRWAPYYDRLEPQLGEIEAAQGWEPGSLRAALLDLLDAGAPTAQQGLEARVEELMRSRGFEHEWGDDLEPLKALRL
jgi:hypothetical protein